MPLLWPDRTAIYRSSCGLTIVSYIPIASFPILNIGL